MAGREIFQAVKSRRRPSFRSQRTLAADLKRSPWTRQGAWRDTVFVERLWHRVTYEEIDLHADANLPEARASIGRYLAFYNSTRPHSYA